MSNPVRKAKDLATERHAHLHLYDVAKTPAIHHIGEVAAFVEQNGGTEDMVAAAWLHDIIEDTDTTLEDINTLFGPDIAALVDGLTDPVHFAPLPLHQRKTMQAERLKNKSDEIKKIKICDQLSNVLRIVNDPPTDWDHTTNFQYARGARQVTEVCRGICPELDALFDRAYAQAEKLYGDVK